MNKMLVLTKHVVIAMSVVGVVYADKEPAQDVLVNRWSGAYIGVDAGVLFNDAQLKAQQLGFTSPSNACNANSDFSTFSSGIHLGKMVQFPNRLVLGLETNISVNVNQEEFVQCRCLYNPNVSDNFSFNNTMQTAIKGRVGPALDWNKTGVLPYITAGVSFADVGLNYNNEGGDYYSKTTFQSGGLVGAGIEWAFSPNWSIRAEYAYINYGTPQLKLPSVYGLIDLNGNARVDFKVNNAAIAINYWY